MKKILIFFFSFLFVLLTSDLYLAETSDGQNNQQTTQEKKVVKKKNNKNRSKKVEEESCYELGYRYGKCGVLTYKGRKCNPKDDIIIPERCRGLERTQAGINDGGKSVW